MLSIIGLGLRDGDIARNGVTAVAEADAAYAECYTNSVTYDFEALTERTGTPITVLDREQVENEDVVIQQAAEQDVAFLVSGDPLTATTHQDILFRARDAGIETRVIHAPSIVTAVAETGLSLYKFGRTTTLPEPYNGTIPDSPFDVVQQNREQGLHTLMLLDIGMAAEDALEHVAGRLPEDSELLLGSRLGTEHATIHYGTLPALEAVAGEHEPPVSLIVPGDLSDNEADRLHRFTADAEGTR